jgi:hypothetical protein
MAILFLEAKLSTRMRVPVPASVYYDSARPTANRTSNLLQERRGVEDRF